MFIKCFSKVSFVTILIVSCTWAVTVLLYFNLSISKSTTSLRVTKINKSEFVPDGAHNLGNVVNIEERSHYSNNSLKPVFLNSLDPLVIEFHKHVPNSLPARKLIYNIPISEDRYVNELYEFGVVRNLDDQYTRDIGYKQHAFNTLVSNNIGLYRNIPDTRHKLCDHQSLQIQKSFRASIVMCFYNEHLMTLLRSINTIFHRTPPELLKEIILVDDYSDYYDLKEKLERELKELDPGDKVKLIRNKHREGLIRARVIGSRQATGEVLVFLDSHIEVNNRWIEPLLAKISHEKSTLAVPVIDIINADTFSYTPSPLVRGGFNWGLHFKWEGLPDGTLHNESSFLGPFISPTMAGGLFAVDKKYFKHIGEYDMGMDIWGGENLEISFRTWQCGGSIKILPCSRVGHIFRKRRPYSSPDGSNTMLRNSLRLANVWMDEYKDHFLKNQKVKNFDYGDVSDRLRLRNDLKCRPFSWYLKTVYPEIGLPGNSPPKSPKAFFQPWYSRKRTYIGSFQLRLHNSTLCISAGGAKTNGLWKRGGTLSLKPCLRAKNQIWYETDKSELILDKLYCLEASHSSGQARPVLGKCHEMLGDQEWRHIKSAKSPIYNTATGSCLRTSRGAINAEVILDLCSNKDFGSWDIVYL